MDAGDSSSLAVGLEVGALEVGAAGRFELRDAMARSHSPRAMNAA
jgi:hypothetical protein